jgi:hypothetical protein
MNTVNQSETIMRSSDEQGAENQALQGRALKADEQPVQKLAWQRPVLKVLQIESARKTFSTTADGVFTS